MINIPKTTGSNVLRALEGHFALTRGYTCTLLLFLNHIILSNFPGTTVSADDGLNIFIWVF